jgi:integrase/recombinase XerD
MPRIVREWNMTPKQERMLENLWRQVEKHFNFNSRAGQGYRGTERYLAGIRSVLSTAVCKFNLQNIRNLQDKHLRQHIQDSKEAGVSIATIKNELSAIRKLHSIIPNTRYELSENKDLGLTEKRVTRGVDRAWRDSEVQKAVNLAHSMGRYDVKWALSLARSAGLRIEEVTALTKTQLRDALKNGYLHLRQTKGGIQRDVPLSQAARQVCREILTHASNEKIFIKHGRTHHQAFHSIQNWIHNHREKFQEDYTPDERYIQDMRIDIERPNLTFHGLRHAYAREQYHERIDKGMSAREARQEVAELLGHGRDDVTRVYLGK